MRNFIHGIFRSILPAVFVCAAASGLAAQSLIFNIPSTDTQEKGSVYLEGDIYAHFDKYRNCGFQSLSPRVTYGVTKNLEIGGNVVYTREEGGSVWEYQPNVKFKAYENKNEDVAVAAGAILFVPLNRAAGTRMTAFLYANASKEFQAARGLRLTGGVYQAVGAKSDFGTKTGVMVGIEQPVTKRLTLLADWASGNNSFGYTTGGLAFDVTGSQAFGAAYSVGNSGRANNFFTAYYGVTF